MSESRTDVVLAASASLEGRGILVEFSVHNGSKEPIYLLAHPGDFDRVRARGGEAYVLYDEEERRIIVSLVPPDPPLEADFGVGVESLSRRLAPGADYSAVIPLGMPVRCWDPYRDVVPPIPVASPGGEMPATDRIRFQTEWTPESGGELRQPGPDPDTWWFVGVGGGRLIQDLRLPHPVPVDLSPPDPTSSS